MQGTPFIPENIVVHLGRPDENAENVSVSFPEYIKNVASSEIYPTWNENAIRANVYAIVSYVLNRVYTEYYRSRGYDFDITASTQYDQAYVRGRDIFEPISIVVDELFNDYVRKQGQIQPYFTAFCNGTTVTCEGLSQWGSQNLAQQGYTPYEILTNYYGKDIDIVKNAPVQPNIPTYPLIPLTLGFASNDVSTVQIRLNRISTNYPAIPKIYPVDGVYGVETENAVKAFQEIFNLPQTGVVDKATWYKINYIYISVKKLAELNSEGIALSEVPKQFKTELRQGDSGQDIRVLQYYLAVIGNYYEAVTPVEITGNFGAETTASVQSFQKVFGLPQTGVVNKATWNDLYRAYAGIIENVPIPSADISVALYPGTVLKEGMTNEYIRLMQQYLTYIGQTYTSVPAVNDTGYFGPLTKASVTAFQREFGLTQNGLVGAATWDKIADVYSDLRFGYVKNPEQFPGYVIKGGA